MDAFLFILAILVKVILDPWAMYSLLNRVTLETASCHYIDAIMSAIASQITGVSTVYPNVCSGTGQIKHHSSASLAFVRVIHRWPVNSPNKWPVTRKMFPFDDIIMVMIPLCRHWRSRGYRFNNIQCRHWRQSWYNALLGVSGMFIF